MTNRFGGRVGMAVAVAFLITISSTAFGEEKADNKGTTPVKTEDKKTPEVPAMKVAPGDWCDEHGVPESVCSKCSTKAAAAFKEKGDWCKKHARADSQCFICHPELKEKWLALKPKEAEGKETEKKEAEKKEPEKK